MSPPASLFWSRLLSSFFLNLHMYDKKEQNIRNKLCSLLWYFWMWHHAGTAHVWTTISLKTCTVKSLNSTRFSPFNFCLHCSLSLKQRNTRHVLTTVAVHFTRTTSLFWTCDKYIKMGKKKEHVHNKGGFRLKEGPTGNSSSESASCRDSKLPLILLSSVCFLLELMPDVSGSAGVWKSWTHYHCCLHRVLH